MKSHHWIGAAASALLGSVLVVGSLTIPTSAAMAQTSGAVVRGLPDFTELVEQVGPSVVNIRTLEKARPSAAASGGPEDEMQELFRRFFGVPMPNAPRQAPRPNRPESEAQPRGVGSGFILSPDGFIMTNAHVVDGADEVLVTLPDKREFRARIVGADKRTDVAVVKIQATGLPAVKVGDVSRLRVGEWVMAIGSPFGLDNTVTAGIVSAKQRDTGDFLPFIQTDVAINPGNSGGPLINMRGEVVGINSQIYSRSGGFMGISFAIPMDEAIRVSDQLRASGRVSRGRIGVQIAPVTKDVAESIGLGKAQGVLVRGVEEGSPAEKAGVEAGDIIVRFDGKVIEKPADLPRAVGNTRPGNRVTLTVFRRGAQRDLSVTVAELEPEKPAGVVAEKKSPPATVAHLGLTLSDLSDAQRKEARIRAGVRVDAAVDAAARAGIREGDLILAVANSEVASVQAFEALVARIDKSRPLSLLIRRGSAVDFVTIRPTP
ncbi:MAG: DegQ family serine endoprotease [Limnohabitans sp.]|uniref:DegQ family serine endoprotease n=1 Tax=Limnohabitans sp. TaxID=1907725 RepID=UPI003919CA7E